MKTIILITMAALIASQAHGQLTGEARILREKRDAKIAEINRIYIAELEKLKTKAVNSVDVATTEALAEEIAIAKGEKPDTNKFTPDQLVGTWIREQSGKYDGDIFKFSTPRRGSHNGKTNFDVTASSTGFIIKSNKWINTLTTTDDPNKLEGETPDGKTYILTRQP